MSLKHFVLNIINRIFNSNLRDECDLLTFFKYPQTSNYDGYTSLTVMIFSINIEQLT